MLPCWRLWASAGRVEAGEYVKHAGFDLLVVTMTQDPHRTFSKEMTPNSSHIQRGECLEYCQIVASIMGVDGVPHSSWSSRAGDARGGTQISLLALFVALKEKENMHPMKHLFWTTRQFPVRNQ